MISSESVVYISEVSRDPFGPQPPVRAFVYCGRPTIATVDVRRMLTHLGFAGTARYTVSAEAIRGERPLGPDGGELREVVTSGDLARELNA